MTTPTIGGPDSELQRRLLDRPDAPDRLDDKSQVSVQVTDDEQLGASPLPRLRLVAIVDASADTAEAVRGYEDRVLGLLDRHGGRLEERLFGADGRTEVQTISFADEAGYLAFLADPQRAAYREEIGDAAPEARVVWVAHLSP